LEVWEIVDGELVDDKGGCEFRGDVEVSEENGNVALRWYCRFKKEFTRCVVVLFVGGRVLPMKGFSVSLISAPSLIFCSISCGPFRGVLEAKATESSLSCNASSLR